MSPSIAVLKFGGSVLRGPDDLHRIAAKIERWRRRGHRVVAVVSAPLGTTDQRIEELRGADLGPHAYAAALAAGERTSANSLAAALQARGTAAEVLDPAALGLVAGGPPLEASPIGLSQGVLRACLARDRVAVVPGFAAIDSAGRCVLLGRGGSDLTALFLAAELGVDRCVLVKDVDGLYERDPREDPDARRYLRASWQAALHTDGSIIQHAALRAARDRGRDFEIGSITGQATTLIGTHSSAFAEVEPKAAPARVALLGFGTVGQGVAAELDREPEHFRITDIAVRGLSPERSALRPSARWTDDPLRAAAVGADLVIDCMGDSEAALACVEVALARGSHVITADKVLVARHGARLRRRALSQGAGFAYSASIGGAVPILERLALEPPVHVRAVLNGTANFVLQEVAAGGSLNAAIERARRLGYAEADPSRDLEGWDAAHKLALLSETLGLGALDPASIPRATIGGGVVPGVRQIAELRATPRGPVARVTLQVVQPHEPLAGLPGAWNGAEWTCADGAKHWIHGQGAGQLPTAAALVADALDARRARLARERKTQRPRETHRMLA